MSERRWTGGTANREWQRGTRPQPPGDAGTLAAQVARYLHDCRRFRQLLSPAHHPTEEGCLKLVYHQGDTQKATILAAYRQMTRARPR